MRAGYPQIKVDSRHVMLPSIIKHLYLHRLCPTAAFCRKSPPCHFQITKIYLHMNMPSAEKKVKEGEKKSLYLFFSLTQHGRRCWCELSAYPFCVGGEWCWWQSLHRERENVLATMAPTVLTAQSHLFQPVHSSETI